MLKTFLDESPFLAAATAKYHEYLNSKTQPAFMTQLEEEDYFQQALWPGFRHASEKVYTANTTTTKLCFPWVNTPKLVGESVLLAAHFFNYRDQYSRDKIAEYLSLFDQDEETVRFLFEAIWRLVPAQLSTEEACVRLSFLTICFGHLDRQGCRKSLGPLVSLPIWIHLSENFRNDLIDRMPNLRRQLSKVISRSKKRSKEAIIPLSELAIFQLVQNLEFLIVSLMQNYSEDALRVTGAQIRLITELISQVRTRQTILPLLQDRCTLPLIQGLSNSLAFDMTQPFSAVLEAWMGAVSLFASFVNFPVDEISGEAVPLDEMRARRSTSLLKLQKVAHAISKREKHEMGHPFLDLALSPQSVIQNFRYLRGVLSLCGGPILEEIMSKMCLLPVHSYGRAANMGNKQDAEIMKACSVTAEVSRKISIALIAAAFCEHLDPFESVCKAPVLVQGHDLLGVDESEARVFGGNLPSLNLDFLSMTDYLLRLFTLYKWEVSSAVQGELKRDHICIAPRIKDGKLDFRDVCCNVIPIKTVRLEDIGEPLLNSEGPSYVHIKVECDLSRCLNTNVWGLLEQHEELFMVSHTDIDVTEDRWQNVQEKPESLLKECKVRAIIAYPRGRPSDAMESAFDAKRFTVEAELDTIQYSLDSQNEDDVLEGFGLLMRREGLLRISCQYLYAIRELIKTGRTLLPSWLEKIILGRQTVQDSSVSTDAVEDDEIDFGDTFLNGSHIESSFPTMQVSVTDEDPSGTEDDTYYALRFVAGNKIEARAVRKDFGILLDGCSEGSVAPNKLLFDQHQIAAIAAAMRPGLTLISGPPGTGKTSCMVQIICNLLRGSSEERILVILRTDHALDQFRELINARNVDHARVVQFKEELDTETSGVWASDNPVDILLYRRNFLLSKTRELSRTLPSEDQIIEEEEWSCGAAEKFAQLVIQPKWNTFRNSTDQVWEKYPFRKYSLLNIEKSSGIEEETTSFEAGEEWDTLVEYSKIATIFSELEELWFLEVLRNADDRIGFVLSSYSRVVVMTAAFVAKRRSQLAKYGFACDSIFIDQATQLREIETLVPLLVPSSGEADQTSRLKRVVMFGNEYLQPPGAHKNEVQRLRNMGQSMFSRLARLDNRVYKLYNQARCRKSIADTYREKGGPLYDMPTVQSDVVYQKANGGLAYTMQFIDTGDANSEERVSHAQHRNNCEAEYIIFVYIYLRLRGYSHREIKIVTASEMQAVNIQYLLPRRLEEYPEAQPECQVSSIGDVDGIEGSIVLLSLVKTSNFGHVIDGSELLRAFSRARLGLYIFGYEAQHATNELFRPLWSNFPESRKLKIVNDTFSTCSRLETDDVSNLDLEVREVYSSADMAEIVGHMYAAMTEEKDE